jgi:hypothetical protein
MKALTGRASEMIFDPSDRCARLARPFVTCVGRAKKGNSANREAFYLSGAPVAGWTGPIPRRAASALMA